MSWRSPPSPFLPSKSQSPLRATVGAVAAAAKAGVGKGKHKIDRHRRAYLDALNAKRRAKRRLAREAQEAAGTARRRGRKPKGNGAQPHGNGATVSAAAALWEQARKLEPRQPWRAVARELGISEGAAQVALRNLAVPEDVSPAAVARFLTLR